MAGKEAISLWSKRAKAKGPNRDVILYSTTTEDRGLLALPHQVPRAHIGNRH